DPRRTRSTPVVGDSLRPSAARSSTPPPSRPAQPVGSAEVGGDGLPLPGGWGSRMWGRLRMIVITEARVEVPDAELGGLERGALGGGGAPRGGGGGRGGALPAGGGGARGGVPRGGRGWCVVMEGGGGRGLAAPPRPRGEARRLAFGVGNRHFTLAIERERLLV